MKKITSPDFEKILGFNIIPQVNNMINNFNLSYITLSRQERDKCILHIINTLSHKIIQSGEHRLNEWESSWKENLKLFKQTKNTQSLIPKYHGKYKIFRWKGNLVKSNIDLIDYKIHISFVDAILNHYLNNNKNIIEFGCGPGYHLIRLNQYNKNLRLFGCDWAKSSQKTLQEINKILKLNITPVNFDFFHPINLNIMPNTMIFTVAALEQVGNNFKPFLDFILKYKPNICINIEPISELLDNNKLLDNLSIRYFKKRKYLSGYLPYLEKLEKNNKIKIIQKQRIFSGSYFIEGHSLIVWKPI